MKVPIGGAAIGVLAVAGGALVAVNSGPHPAAGASNARLVSSSTSTSAADQAALAYAAQHYPGSGSASVLRTEPDSEAGVRVFDVTVKAPNGSTYTIAINAGTDAVMGSVLEEPAAAPTAAPTPTGTAPAHHEGRAETTEEPAEPSSATPRPKGSPEAGKSPDNGSDRGGSTNLISGSSSQDAGPTGSSDSGGATGSGGGSGRDG